MALVKCDECGTEISEKAPTCPKCGVPRAWVKGPPDLAPDRPVELPKAQPQALGIVAICLAGGSLVLPVIFGMMLAIAAIICALLAYRNGQKGISVIATILAFAVIAYGVAVMANITRSLSLMGQ